jgi:hypothetical protein
MEFVGMKFNGRAEPTPTPRLDHGTSRRYRVGDALDILRCYPRDARRAAAGG